MIGEKEEREKEGESSRECREGTMHLEERGERECLSKRERERKEKDHAFICVVMVELKPSHATQNLQSRKDQRFSHSTSCADG